MQTLTEILALLIDIFGSLYLCAILLRFLLQTARADFYNPLSQLLVKVTNPLLIPLRRVIPGFWGIDFAALVLAVLFHWFALQLMVWVMGGSVLPPLSMFIWSLFALTLNIITIYFVASLIIFITSFLAPYSRHPMIVLSQQILEPLMAPIRRYIPPTGGLDFSLFFVGIFLMIIRLVVIRTGSDFSVPIGSLIGYQF